MAKKIKLKVFCKIGGEGGRMAKKEFMEENGLKESDVLRYYYEGEFAVMECLKT